MAMQQRRQKYKARQAINHLSRSRSQRKLRKSGTFVLDQLSFLTPKKSNERENLIDFLSSEPVEHYETRTPVVHTPIIPQQACQEHTTNVRMWNCSVEHEPTSEQWNVRRYGIRLGNGNSNLLCWRLTSTIFIDKVVLVFGIRFRNGKIRYVTFKESNNSFTLAESDIPVENINIDNNDEMKDNRTFKEEQAPGSTNSHLKLASRDDGAYVRFDRQKHRVVADGNERDKWIIKLS